MKKIIHLMYLLTLASPLLAQPDIQSKVLYEQNARWNSPLLLPLPVSSEPLQVISSDNLNPKALLHP
ncbi:hypothetical protein [Telluribacter sp.]|uniref:hypothetical protein n=1 Tax=Telluribacter sp. TaxID=1978767 RepID=UPI002E0FBE24|nr:hypothetical protein [Telluribacter sp.]